MKTLKLLAASIAVFLLVACDNALDRKYSPETYAEDIQTLVDRDLLTRDDMVALTFYMVQENIKGNSLEGRTYREMLKEARAEKK